MIRHLFFKEHVESIKLGTWRGRFKIPSKYLKDSTCVTEPVEGAVNVFHKHFNMHLFMDWIREYGGIFDITDYHFDEELKGEYYRDMCKYADIITCTSNNLSSWIFNHTNKIPVIIPDPIDVIEFEECEPEYKNTKSVCWFGNEVNIRHANSIELPCDYEAVTSSNWSIENIRGMLKRHDIVLVPYGDTVAQSCKTPNRIMNAIYSGKIVVTNDTPPAYDYGLRRYCITNNDISEGIKWVWDNPEKALEMTRKGQLYIKENYSPEKIAEKWKGAICKAERKLQVA